jgi:RNA polymerase sigma factor (sigma-70 family)
MNEDAELLRRYVEEGANDAFSELVQRHVNFVYSAALRQLNGDAHLAADATQIVFTDLARKARALIAHRVLAGWLFTSTRYVTAKLIRGERRRHTREVEAQLMHETHQEDSVAPLDWQRVRPVLDDVIGALSDSDREAILLRFFEGRDYAAVGAKLNLNDNTARMRVERALDKLRALLERRGVKSTSAALAVALANQAVTAAPAGLAGVVAGAALAGGASLAGVAATATAGGSATAGILNFMSITTVQLGISSALAVAGASGLVLQATTNAKLREEAAQLRAENATVTTVQAENLRLGRLAVEVAEMRRDDAELARLQNEAGVLKTRLQKIALAEQARTPRRDASGQVYDLSALDQVPVARFQARPQYPFEMRRAGISGEVVVDFLVDANGDVQNARAIRSSRPEFEPAAVQAVSKWKFNPGKKGGADVVTHLQVPIVFTTDAQTPRKEASPSSPTPPAPDKSASASAVQLTPFHAVATGPQAAAPSPAGARE